MQYMGGKSRIARSIAEIINEIPRRKIKNCQTHCSDNHAGCGGGDFFQCVPPACDYIISNPPYSVKGQVLQRLFDIGKPFAMLVGVVGLFESQERFEMFRENEFEIMYFNRRVAYFQSYQDPKPSLNPPFSSVYVCHKMLPEKMVFEEIEKR